MNFNEYQELAKRTAPKSQKNRVMANLALGTCGEAGELGELFKKHLFHDHSLDTEEVKKEAGDVLWYLSNLLEVCGIKFEDVAQLNIEKLKKRYPEGFTSEGSLKRVDVK